jgi:hypothetical protein
MNDIVSIRKIVPVAGATGRGPAAGFGTGISEVGAVALFAEDVFRGGKFPV